MSTFGVRVKMSLFRPFYAVCHKVIKSRLFLWVCIQRQGQMEFIKQHRRRLRNFSYTTRCLLSGSSSEIPAVYFSIKPTDIDFMMYNAILCAVPKDSHPPHNFKGEVLTIEPQNDFPGYVTLKNSRYECYKHFQTYHYDNRHGPAV